MGKWDGEIIELLPKTVKVYASAGAGYDWVDTHALAKHGSSPPFSDAPILLCQKKSPFPRSEISP